MEKKTEEFREALIFGAIFQSAMDQEQRRNLGAHYTSEKNIMKLIKPLFLDELYDEFKKVKSNKNKLQEFHNKIANLKFLDPACGCGNFLIIAYRELRELELQIIKRLYGTQAVLDVSVLVKVNIDQFYGIEIEELPAKIAEVAMWLVDHQMNIKLSEALGQYFARIPLTNINNIVHANALRMQWQDLVEPTELNYILGNPPFYGKQYQTAEQKEDMASVFHGVKGYGVLDFVTAWYIKAAQFIQNTKIKVAFVSTNSISQGEQVGILWNELFNNYGIKIHFAHRTFAWSNEARGKAAVFCVIIGFANYDTDQKFIYEYETPKSEPHEVKAKNINGYLVEGSDIALTSRTKALSNVPEIKFGNQPIDDGGLIFNDEEYNHFITKYPEKANLLRKYIGAKELINGGQRWCLWLKGIEPKQYSNIPEVLERLKKVQDFRKSRKSAATSDIQDFPYLFASERHPDSGSYIAIPSVSSERRKYVPIVFYSSDIICSNLCLIIPNATLYHFGILTSLMHNDWMRYTAGRLKSDYRYSNKLVYNNFPFPKNPSEKHIQTIEQKAQGVLDARAKYPDSGLADLYNPLTMPKELVKAHNELDKAVDLSYRKAAFKDERERIEFLFNLYQEYLEEEKK
jgi:hypothetical protein